jgi:hypothetical protein
MKSFTNDDFLRLVEELTERQYGLDSADEESENYWMPADPAAKDKIKKPGEGGGIDISKIRKEDIQDMLYKHTNFKIGVFLIRITKYHSYPVKNKASTDLKMDLAFWHEVTKTATGAPCKMTYRFDIGKDNRFSNRSWLSYLTSKAIMKDVPVETVVDIFRWFQALHRMTAFL